MRYLATRFSAKEAFSKAIGLGMRMPMTWRGCEIVKLPSGKPEIRLHGELAEWFEARGPARPCQRHRRGRLRRQLRRRRNAERTDEAKRPTRRVVLDVAGLALDDDDRRRLRASAHRRGDPVRPQLARPARSSPSWWPRSRRCGPTCWSASTTRAGACSASAPTASPHLPPMRVLGEMWMDDGRGAPGSGAMRALEAATAAGHVLGAASCAPAASTSASRRCSTSTTAAAA